MPATNKKEIRNDYISVRKFAKQLGLKSHNSIIEAMDSGVISDGVYVHPRNGHRKILPEIALKEWNDYHNDGEPTTDNVTIEKRGGGKSDRTTLVNLKQQQAQVKLQMELIKLKQLKGELVEKDLVYKELFEFGKQIKDAIMVIPDRIIDELIASKSRAKAHGILTDALSDALKTLSETNKIKV